MPMPAIASQSEVSGSSQPAAPLTLPPERPRVAANELLDGRPLPASFEELPSLLGRGHEIVVTDEAGQSTRGRISTLSSTRLVIVRKRFRFSRPQAREFDGDSVRTIRIVDSTWNGGLLGAAAAAGVLAALVESECSSGCDDNFGRSGRWIVRGFLFVPIGIGLGTTIDSRINTPIYERQKGISRVTVFPTFLGARKSVLVQVHF
jgi:hypothetical protein